MFEHLPQVTEESIAVVVEKEIPCFCELVQGCTETFQDLNELMDCVCKDIDETNPWLGKALRASMLGIINGFKDNLPGVEGIEQVTMALTAPGILGLLRLVDRALEVTDLEKMK